MTTYHINPNAADNTGSGTAASPKKTLAGITLAAGDKVLFLRGTTYADTFAPTVAGTSSAPITYGAYANADGSDNLALPRPIVTLSAVVSTYASTNKDFINYSDLDVRATVAVANDTAVFYLGQNASFKRMRVDTNVGCLAAYNKSNLVIEDCELNGVSHGSSNNNNLITISADNTHIDNIKILNNVLNHKGGGGSSSHIVRAETNSIAYALTRLVIKGNKALPPGGAEKNPNMNTIGLRLARCPGVVIDNNTINGVLSGAFVSGGSTIISKGKIRKNTFDQCWNFGIHLPGGTRDFIIERNRCWHPGTNAGASYYGRGIEISSSAGDGQNGGHIIRFNSCCYAKNYGGPEDNASEGVGIGLDDGCDTCTVYGNIMSFNEGNGLQHYGGTGTQTGGHVITGNYFESNCTASFKNRRTGGTQATVFNAHCGFNAHKGKTSYVANNYFAGSTKAAISQTATCQNNIVKANNVFEDVPYAICMPSTHGQAYNNLFYNPVVTGQRYSDVTTTAGGEPTYPALSFTGENDYAFNPLLDSKKRPRANSPCVKAGKYLGQFYDQGGLPFKLAPSIGMYEIVNTDSGT